MIDKNNIYKRAIACYGETLQMVVAMEEMSELIKELSKEIRGMSTKTQILTEVADVEIMIDQIKIIKGITDREIEEEVEYKLARLNSKMLEDDYEAGNKALQERAERL